ncbi:MAG: putative glycoside hydrolase, partial [Patescibacteria group bacterium]
KTPRAEVIKEFFSYLRRELGGLGVPLSADLFGMTTTNADDLNIGQILEYAAPYFDYIAPMVYPSHYPSGFINLKNPAAHPYEVVHYSMKAAVEKLLKASSTPSKLRPWLQDFDLGADYNAEMVRKQMQAVYNAGLTSWMMWDAGNKYTRDAYLQE